MQIFGSNLVIPRCSDIPRKFRAASLRNLILTYIHHRLALKTRSLSSTPPTVQRGPSAGAAEHSERQPERPQGLDLGEGRAAGRPGASTRNPLLSRFCF